MKAQRKSPFIIGVSANDELFLLVFQRFIYAQSVFRFLTPEASHEIVCLSFYALLLALYLLTMK